MLGCGAPLPTVWVCTLPRCPILGQADAHCAHSWPPRIGGGAAGPRGEERSLRPRGPISIQGSKCANAGQTPILLTHKTPGLAASPGSCPSPSPAAPTVPKQSPLSVERPGVPSRAPMHGPISRAAPTPGAQREVGKMSGRAGGWGHTRRERSLARASPRGGLLVSGPEVLPGQESRVREGPQEGPSGAGRQRQWGDGVRGPRDAGGSR